MSARPLPATARAAGLAVVLAVAALLALPTPASAQAGVMQRIVYGKVVSAQQTVVMEQRTGSGAQAGSTVGAVAGYALADRGDRWLGGLLGGVVGAAVGNGIEKKSRKKKGWELIIRLDSGEEIGIQVPGQREQYRPGDRVRMMSGGGRTKVSRV